MGRLRCVLILLLFGCGDDGGDGGDGGGNWSGAGPWPDDCEDTSSDPYHCGACGHTCWGGPCLDGVCQAVQQVNDPGTVEVVADDYALGGHGEIYIQPLATYLKLSEPSAFTRDHAGTRAFAIDGGLAYWTGPEGIYRCDLDGCFNNPEHIYAETAPSAEQAQLGSAAMAVAGGKLVVARQAPIFDTYPTLATCDVDNCSTLTTIYTSPERPWMYKVVTDGTYAAWIEGQELWGCTLASCDATKRLIAPVAMTSRAGGRAVLAIADGHLAWTAVDDTGPGRSGAMVCAYADCTSPTRLYELEGYIFDMTFHAGRVYVNGQNGVFSCPIAGCGAAPDPVPIAPYNTLFYVSDNFYVLGNGKVAR